MTRDYFDLAGEVLDHSIVDVNDYPCGKVDDIEIEGSLTEGLRVKALLVGPGVWLTRLPRWVSKKTINKLFGNQVIAVPWEEIQQITPKVKLKINRSDARFGRS